MKPQEKEHIENLKKKMSSAILVAIDKDVSIEEVIGAIEHIKYKIQNSAYEDINEELKTIEGYR